MESRNFIKQAALITSKIEKIKLAVGPTEERDAAREQVQKELSQLFGGLQNPTLPSATKLRDLAVSAGLSVDPKVLNRLQQGEGMWG